MNRYSRIATGVAGAALLATLAACSTPMEQTYPYQTGSYPAPSYPSTSYPAYGGAYGSQPNYVEFGRVTNVEVLTTQERRDSSPAGAVIGGLVGGVLGNQIGHGSGRSAATAAGVVGGALAGNAIGRQNSTQAVSTYRVTVRVDNGELRSYDMSTPGELRPGDRVRIENGVLYRS